MKLSNRNLEVFMKGKRFFGCVVVLALIGSMASCVTGTYMSLHKGESAGILGSVNADFTITGSFRYRKVINTQAYMHLLTEAQKEYPGIIVDVRDISWAIGEGDSASNNYSYTAVGTVIRK